MKNSLLVIKRLQSLGLTDDQAELYIYLLRRGNVRISEISRELELARSTVYEHTKRLMQLGLIEEITENSYKVIRAYPVSALRHRLDNEVASVKRKQSELEVLERSLDKLTYQLPAHQTLVRSYKGKSGAQQLFWNSLKAQNTVYVYSEWGRGRYLGIEFYRKFVAESAVRNICEQVLVNATPAVHQSIDQHNKSPLARTNINDVRVLPIESITVQGETLIYNNIYACVYLKDKEISGFEIESQNFTDLQRQIFDQMWASAGLFTDLS